MLSHVLPDSRVLIGTGCARWNVMEHFRIFDAVLPAQFAIVGEDEFLDVIAIRRDVVIAQ